jgi:choline dehydrogenase-like flavoprotein
MSFGTGLYTGVEGADLNEAAFEAWRVNKTGVVASITARTNFFLRSDFAKDARPDGQVIVTPPGWTAFALCYLNKPRSTGEVRLFSNNPTDLPLVTANYFQDPQDLEAMIDIMNKTYQILHSAPIHAYPFNQAYDMTNKAALKTYILGDPAAWVSANAGSGYHFVGTNKMGDPAKDPNAVVDNRLRVVGVVGLRVADASIFPDIPTGNTQYPTYMVGEKAADLILKDWK